MPEQISGISKIILQILSQFTYTGLSEQAADTAAASKEATAYVKALTQLDEKQKAVAKGQAESSQAAREHVKQVKEQAAVAIALSRAEKAAAETTEKRYKAIKAKHDAVRAATKAEKESVDQINETSAAFRKGTAAVTPFGIGVRAAKNALDAFSISGPLAVAAGVAIYEVVKRLIEGVLKLAGSFYAMGTAFQTWQAQLTVLLGGAEQAAAAIEFVRKAALETPFDLPGLMNAVRLMRAFGLDYQYWFGRVADVAALTGKSVDQVVRAIGLLASGATGRGLYYLRLLGISTQDLGLAMDSSGQAINATQDILERLVKFIDTKFGGGAKAMSRTWIGVMQNMSDAFKQFAGYIGRPILDTLAVAFQRLVDLATANLPLIERVGTAIGTALANAISVIDPMIEALIILGSVAAQVADIIMTAFAQAAAFITGIMNQLIPGLTGFLSQIGGLIGNILSRIFPGARRLVIPVRGAVVPGAEEVAAEEALRRGAGAGAAGRSPEEEAARAELEDLQHQFGELRRGWEAQRDALRAGIEAAQEIRQQEIDAQQDLLLSLEENLDAEKDALERIKEIREEEVKLRLAQVGIDEDQLEIAEAAAKESVQRARLVLDKVSRTTRKYGDNILNFEQMNANALLALAEEQQTRVELQRSIADRIRTATEAQYADDIALQEERVEIAEDQVRRQRDLIARMRELDSRARRVEEARLREFDRMVREAERAWEARIAALRHQLEGMARAATGAGVPEGFFGLVADLSSQLRTLPDTLEAQQQRVIEALGLPDLQEVWNSFVDWLENDLLPRVRPIIGMLGGEEILAGIEEHTRTILARLDPATESLGRLKGPLGDIAEDLGYIALEALPALRKEWGEFLDMTEGARNILGPIASTFDKMATAMSNFTQAVSGAVQIIVGTIQLFSGLLRLGLEIYKVWTGKESPEEAAIKLRGAFDRLREAGETLAGGFQDFSEGVNEAVLGRFRDLAITLGNISNALEGNNLTLEGMRDSFAKGLTDILYNPLKTLHDNLVGENGDAGLIGDIAAGLDTILGWFKAKEGIADPTTSGIEESWRETERLLIGRSIIPDIERGINRAFDNMARDLPQTVKNTTDAIKKTWTALKVALLNPKNGIITTMVAEIKKVLDLAEWAYAAGQDLLYNWIEGLRSNWVPFTNAIKAILAELDKIPRRIYTVVTVVSGDTGISDTYGGNASDYVPGPTPDPGIRGGAQFGRYIEEGGIYRLHPGEIVVPANTVDALARFLSSGWPEIMQGLAFASGQLADVAYLARTQQFLPVSRAPGGLNVNVTVHGAVQPQAVADNVVTAIDDWWWQQVRR